MLLPSLRPLLHAVCRSRSDACWLIIFSVLFCLWHSLVWNFLSAASCPSLVPHCWPPVLVLAPAPASSSACLCSRQELFPLCGCCDPVEGGQDGRSVPRLRGKACLASLGLTCSVGMPCIKSFWCWGREAGSGCMKYSELCCHRNSS